MYRYCNWSNAPDAEQATYHKDVLNEPADLCVSQRSWNDAGRFGQRKPIRS